MATVEDVLVNGQQGETRLLVRIPKPLTAEGLTGSHLMLALRYRGASWSDAGICHIALCAERPDSETWWEEKSRFAWVESHAGFQKLAQK